jgi:signal transduction histidine kinase
MLQRLQESGGAFEACRVSKTVSSNHTAVFERKSPVDPSRLEQVFIYRSRTQENEPGAVIIRISDVTEAKKMERQMIQQEKMASLGLLISSIVHEINNSNSMISLNLPILKDYLDAIMPVVRSSKDVDRAIEHLDLTLDEFQKDIFDLLENIEHGSDHINSLISQLKEFSRINKHKKADWIDINEVVRKALTICSAQLKSTAVSLHLDIPEDFPKVYTNAEYLEQVLINLLINASQSLDKMDGRIRMGAFIGPNWQEHMIIEVSDNGCGMTDETMGRIFEPLFTTKDPRKGTGLGLYVCHNLIENIGGRIEVESQHGHGSTFRVILTGRERRLKPRGRKRAA